MFGEAVVFQAVGKALIGFSFTPGFSEVIETQAELSAVLTASARNR